MRTLRIMKQIAFLCINVRITFQTVKEIVNMRYDGIKKILDGKFISRYDITYTTEENKTKVYEIISRNKNITSIADLKNPAPDGVVIVVTDTKGEKLLLNKEYRMAVGDYVYNFPAGLIDAGETAEVAAARELK